jgi:hypothetical protein
LVAFWLSLERPMDPKRRRIATVRRCSSGTQNEGRIVSTRTRRHATASVHARTARVGASTTTGIHRSQLSRELHCLCADVVLDEHLLEHEHGALVLAVLTDLRDGAHGPGLKRWKSETGKRADATYDVILMLLLRSTEATVQKPTTVQKTQKRRRDQSKRHETKLDGWLPGRQRPTCVR